MKNKNNKESQIPSANQKEFLRKYHKEKNSIRLWRSFLFLAFLLLWEGLSFFHVIDSFFFSSPLQIFSLFFKMCKNFEIFKHIGITLTETFLSFFAVTLLSVIVAISLFTWPKAAKILEPALVVLNSLPKSALAPLIIVWLGTGIKTIIIAGISVAVFGSIINLYAGFLQVEKEKIKLIITLGGGRKDVLFKLIVPSCTPLILSNMKVNIGLCLVGVIIGEFLAAKEGLGYLIIYGSQIFQLDLLILSITILCIIANLFYKTIQYTENKLL